MPDKVYYVTKYALTKGILVIPASIAEEVEGDGGYLSVKDGYLRMWLTKKDWHHLEDSAVARAAEMVELKRISLKRQERKLSKPIKLVPYKKGRR